MQVVRGRCWQRHFSGPAALPRKCAHTAARCRRRRGAATADGSGSPSRPAARIFGLALLCALPVAIAQAAIAWVSLAVTQNGGHYEDSPRTVLAYFFATYWVGTPEQCGAEGGAGGAVGTCSLCVFPAAAAIAHLAWTLPFLWALWAAARRTTAAAMNHALQRRLRLFVAAWSALALAGALAAAPRPPACALLRWRAPIELRCGWRSNSAVHRSGPAADALRLLAPTQRPARVLSFVKKMCRVRCGGRQRGGRPFHLDQPGVLDRLFRHRGGLDNTAVAGGRGVAGGRAEGGGGGAPPTSAAGALSWGGLGCVGLCIWLSPTPPECVCGRKEAAQRGYHRNFV